MQNITNEISKIETIKIETGSLFLEPVKSAIMHKTQITKQTRILPLEQQARTPPQNSIDKNKNNPKRLLLNARWKVNGIIIVSNDAMLL